ncbi:MAG: 2Fe-2S iron-sulfur cluster-binding protein, partial [Clostridia bacterium]|nr:2Fe-2S iron-sulfur cluster-binding protein [Clostridia bacterium]
MEIKWTLNGKAMTDTVAPDTTLYTLLREHDCKSVKCGCETSSCGLCTVFFDEKPVLSCSVRAVRADGHSVTTLEGLQAEAEDVVDRENHKRNQHGDDAPVFQPCRDQRHHPAQYAGQRE